MLIALILLSFDLHILFLFPVQCFIICLQYVHISFTFIFILFHKKEVIKKQVISQIAHRFFIIAPVGNDRGLLILRSFSLVKYSRPPIFFSSIPMYTVKCKNAAGSDVPAAFLCYSSAMRWFEWESVLQACLHKHFFIQISIWWKPPSFLVFMNMKTEDVMAEL